MKDLYYARNSEKYGPFSLEELRYENITPQTLIWFEGLPSWQYAEDVEEIQSIFHPIEQVDIGQVEINQVEIEEKEAPEEEAMLEIPVNEELAAVPVTGSESTVDEVNHQHTVFDNYGFFRRPFSFKGRIRRLEWWVSVVIAHIASSLIAAMESNTDLSSNGIAILLFLLIIWFALAQATKRCHDRGNSGFFMLIPFYGLWMAFGDGDVGQNQYGTNPKGRNF